mmetsp:Transcript_4025/g.12000  ORF Transcript_4025/g.12000 Transcript_4025/m.12000 type:complete len:325 (+) Transcript_4025:69-1043(+)
MQLRRALGHLLRPTWRRCVAAALLYTATAHLGAVIFYAIEGGEERARAVAFQEQLQQRRELVEAALVNDTTARAALDALVSQLDEYANSKQSAPNPDALNWSFGGSLFFVLTIMTTIGYGTFVPYTLAGEVLVVVFGLVGLAVSGACLTVLADGLDKAGAGPLAPHAIVRRSHTHLSSPLRRALRCSSACFASTSPALGGAPSSTSASRSPTGCSAEASLPRRRAGTSSPASTMRLSRSAPSGLATTRSRTATAAAGSPCSSSSPSPGSSSLRASSRSSPTCSPRVEAPASRRPRRGRGSPAARSSRRIRAPGRRTRARPRGRA